MSAIQTQIARWPFEYMIDQPKGGARIPGPLGASPGSLGGRVPGPVGRTLWDKKTQAAQGAVTKAVKTTVMPLPTNDHDNKDVHPVAFALYNSKKKGPAFDDIKQAPSIANCPVASILAALASTSVGRDFIQGIVTETSASVDTDLSGIPPNTLSNPPTGNTIRSSRYFTVTLGRDSIEVSDVLYTDDHDRGWSPLYLRDPNDEALWGSVIEKALAVQLKSYENFDAVDIKANAFWKMITGVDPGVIEIKADTPFSTITVAAKAATSVPSIAASKPVLPEGGKVSPFHGFAMLGVQGSDLVLYDPAKATKIVVSLGEFREKFLAILFRK